MRRLLPVSATAGAQLWIARQQRNVACAQADPTPPLVKTALKQLYLNGTGKKKDGIGQTRVVAAVTGGGGHLLAYMLSEPGASSCLLEALVPYDKSSLLSLLARHQRSAPRGFCSEDMAATMAECALDRALELTPDLAQWPDTVGVASTSTVVSHYTRKGDYRVHAAAVDAGGQGSAYTHTFIKGERSRAGEDAACALLTMRALADSARLGCADEFASLGVRLEAAVEGPQAEPVNQVGERAHGIETLPSQVQFDYSGIFEGASNNPVILLPRARHGAPASVIAPAALPSGALVVSLGSDVEAVVRAAAAAMKQLDRQGDKWTPPAPVLFNVPQGESSPFLSHDILGAPLPLDNTEHNAGSMLRNWGVLAAPPDDTCRLVVGLRLYPAATHVVTAQVALSLLDGSPDFAVESIAKGAKFMIASDDADAKLKIVLASLPSFVGESFALLVPDVNDQFDGRLYYLNDGSPSTKGVEGHYVGTWDTHKHRPHGQGVMKWDNGITYDGEWLDGKYHGFGSKLYSRGGGYKGHWKLGQREGEGINLYGGKWGYDRWEGPFVGDVPHGKGTMYFPGGSDQRVIEFAHGKPLDRVGQGGIEN